MEDYQIPFNDYDKVNRSVALTTPLSGELEGLNEKVKAMLEKSHNVAANGKKLFICRVCGKEGEYMNVKRHIEANHLEGVSIPCNLCEKTSRSRHALTMHVRVSAGHLFWIYRQLIGMSYIALARQVQIYRNISDPLGRLGS